MGKWKKDETEFEVSVTYEEKRGYQSYVPRPVMERLGKPKSIKYVFKGRRTVEVEAGS